MNNEYQYTVEDVTENEPPDESTPRKQDLMYELLAIAMTYLTVVFGVYLLHLEYGPPPVPSQTPLDQFLLATGFVFFLYWSILCFRLFFTGVGFIRAGWKLTTMNEAYFDENEKNIIRETQEVIDDNDVWRKVTKFTLSYLMYYILVGSL